MTELKPGEKYLLKIHEAAAYYSISIKKMRRFCEEWREFLLFAPGTTGLLLIARPIFEQFIEKKYLSGQKQYKKGIMEGANPEN